MENRIKYYRSLNNMTQAELADKLHVSHVTVSSWEVNRTEPNMGQAIQLCKLFGCSVEELFGSSEQDFVVSNEEKSIIELYRSTDETTKEMVKRVLEYKDKLERM